MIKVENILFENPFILASAPPTANINSIKKAFSLGWAGAVIKTISPDNLLIKDVSPRFGVLMDTKGQKPIGFENIELLSRKLLDYWMQGIVELKKEFPSKVIIASIMAPVVKNEWQNLVKKLQSTPIDAFELNFSCPHGMPEKGIGMAIGTNAAISTEIAGWVKEVAKVPVFVKLSPNVTDIGSIASAVEKSGIDGFSAINTVQSMIGIDIETLTPLPSVNGYSTFGGYSGRAIKPIGLRCVSQIRQQSKLPIMAIGGVSSWQDAVEYIAAGADVVQVCTEVMLNGYGIIKDMLKGLEDYMKKKNLSSISSIKGKAFEHITSHSSLDRQLRYLPEVDKKICTGCGKCVTICEESGFEAISIQNKNIIINAEKCDGCSLCKIICPCKAIY